MDNNLYQLFYDAVMTVIKNLGLELIVENFVSPGDKTSQKYSMYCMGTVKDSEKVIKAVLIVPKMNVQDLANNCNVIKLKMVAINKLSSNNETFSADWDGIVKAGYFTSNKGDKYFDIVTDHYFTNTDVSLLRGSSRSNRYIAGIEAGLAASYTRGCWWWGRFVLIFILALYDELRECGIATDDSEPLIDIPGVCTCGKGAQRS